MDVRGFDPEDADYVSASDKSSLWDFTTYGQGPKANRAEIGLWQARIEEEYGVDVSDIEDGNLEDIREGLRLTFLRKTAYTLSERSRVPKLDWIGKQYVVNHTDELPFWLLERILEAFFLLHCSFSAMPGSLSRNTPIFVSIPRFLLHRSRFVA
jgi:hypothetical protein